MNTINTHTFQESVNIQRTAEKIGETRILWGMISIPKIIYHEKTSHTGICKICGTIQYAAIHGIIRLDKYV